MSGCSLITWKKAEGYNTVEKEKKNFLLRVDKANKSNIATHKNTPSSSRAPKRESGVQSLVVQLMMIEPELFHFTIVDHDTHEGIDVIVKSNAAVAVQSSRLYYVEFKYLISNLFNHSFENLYSIVSGHGTETRRYRKRHQPRGEEAFGGCTARYQ